MDTDIKFLSGSGDPEQDPNLGEPGDGGLARGRYEYRNSSSSRNGKQQGTHWGNLW